MVEAQLGIHHENDINAVNIPDLVIRRYDNVGTMVAEISNSANGKGTMYALIIENQSTNADQNVEIMFFSSSIFRFLYHYIYKN
jgi:hypothetical protein